MLRGLLLAVAVLAPQLAMAADMPRARMHHHLTRVDRRAEPSRFIACTTTNFVLFSASTCDGAFDPLSVSGL